MAARPKIKIRHSYVDTYPLTAQRNWVGAQDSAGKRGWWNDFQDTSATCRAMKIDPVNDRYLYFAAGAVLKRRDILLGSTTTIATVSGGSATIDSIFVDSTYVYVGGSFTTILSTTRNNAARINKSSLAIDSTWNPNTNGLVYWITGDPSAAGSAIYMGGAFTTVNGGTARLRAAGFNGSGVVTAWDPALNGTSYCGAWVEDGTDGLAESILIGGSFIVTPIVQRNFVEYTTTGAGTRIMWADGVDGTAVKSIAVDTENSLIYIGGEFTLFVATTRNNIGAISYGYAISDFNPNVSTTAGHTVNAIQLLGDYVYFGGNFTTVGGTARVDIAKISKTGAGTLQPFLPPFTGGALGVLALATFDRTVYVGGDYTAVTACYPVMQGGSYGAYLNAFPDPLFTDTNAFFVTKAGADTNAGTFAAPFLTIEKGRDALTGNFVYVVIADSGTYGEVLTWTDANTGLYALDGYAPTIEPKIGATPGTYGARASGRTMFSTGAASTFCHVSKAGSDSTGSRGNSALPFLTIGAAITAASSGDTINIQDSGTYTEDIDAAAKALTIQAADGEVPTLVNVLTGGTDEHFKANAGVALALYGLNVRELKSGTNDIITGNYPLTVYDCSFSGTTAINVAVITGTNRAISFVNCLFDSLTPIPSWQGDLVITNCYFIGCLTPIIQTSTSVSYVISQCTFKDTLSIGIWHQYASAAGTFETKFCHFDGVTRTAVDTGWAILNLSASTSSNAVHDCIFNDCDTGAIILSCSNNTVKRSLFEDCGANAGTLITVESIQTIYGWTRADVLILSQHGAGTSGNEVENCVSLNASGNSFGGFSIQARTAAFTVTNCTSINAGLFGLSFILGTLYADAAHTVAYTAGTSTGGPPVGIAEYGSGTAGFTSGQSTSITYSIISALAGSATAAATTLLEDPRFALTDPTVDASLKETGRGLFWGNSTRTKNIGATVPVLVISAAGVVVDGITFSGLQNLFQGINESADTYSSTIRYCSFEELTTAGIIKISSGEVSNCLFENYGFGIQCGNSNLIVKNNIANGTSCAGILSGAFVEVINNNTVYQCPYGQFDYQNTSAQVAKNNVYSASGAYDYSGVNEQANSDIELLSPDASVDANSTRLNPLFRDEIGEDFRLQTVEAGYPYDSPAKNIGDDGFDAGAFAYDYGAISTSYTEIDFNTTDYQNPVVIPRSIAPVNLAEGDRDDGTLRSRANAYKTLYRLEWPGSPMPIAQEQALQTMFEADDEEVKITLDGGSTWIDCAIVKSEGFEWNNLTGAWDQDDTPTPVKSITLRAQ